MLLRKSLLPLSFKHRSMRRQISVVVVHLVWRPWRTNIIGSNLKPFVLKKPRPIPSPCPYLNYPSGTRVFSEWVYYRLAGNRESINLRSPVSLTVPEKPHTLTDCGIATPHSALILARSESFFHDANTDHFREPYEPCFFLPSSKISEQRIVRNIDRLISVLFKVLLFVNHQWKVLCWSWNILTAQRFYVEVEVKLVTQSH